MPDPNTLYAAPEELPHPLAAPPPVTSDYDYTPFGDPRAKGWHGENIVPISAPGGASFNVHRQAADSFKGFLAELEGAGYKIDPKVSGGYNLRNITGGTTLSPHAYGVAIDINPPANPYSKDDKGGKLTTDLPPNVGQLAAKWGLDWGGNWTSLKDPMHFQYTGAPISGDRPQTMMAAARPKAASPVQQAAYTAPASAMPLNQLSSLAGPANVAAMSLQQRMAYLQQLQSLFKTAGQPQQQAAAGPARMVGGVNESIPLMAGRGYA